ncbi:MAG: 23S rRNA (adenine(2503)-C(2))-methyltransferase RlmN [Alistipes sp.]|jgi:23S rRNA (adenine2503-C2)-methyltransferase|nr:23S rRNA (adenine(2503)-C(2))-methyltransferase RlmN [Alistipes sp.]
MKERLFGKTLAQLGEVASQAGLPRFAARQIAGWIYRKNACSVAAMTDVSASGRAFLESRYEIGRSAPVRETVSVDGTKKYLFATGGGVYTPDGGLTASGGGVVSSEGSFVEAAMIPDTSRENGGDRATLCVSSQAGCRMGCDFCATGRQGLAHNLTAGDILNQFASLPERDALTNIVYMGMGEPLDNPDEVLRSLEILTSDWGYGWSPTRITVSTAGVAPALERLLAESRAHLAVSLHNPFSDERARIMPIERAYPIESVVEIVRRHFLRGTAAPGSAQRRVSFEYIVMKGLNDSPRHVDGLAKLLNGLSCRINLIRFHKIPGSPYFSPDAATMERFRDALTRKGFTTTIRASRGEDIEAACGLLSTKQAARG